MVGLSETYIIKGGDGSTASCSNEHGHSSIHMAASLDVIDSSEIYDFIARCSESVKGLHLVSFSRITTIHQHKFFLPEPYYLGHFDCHVNDTS